MKKENVFKLTELIKLIFNSMNFRLSQALGSTNVDYLSLPGDGGGSGGQVPHGVPLARAVLDRLGVPTPHQPHQLSQVRDILYTIVA
jgi:hypothetical protein